MRHEVNYSYMYFVTKKWAYSPIKFCMYFSFYYKPMYTFLVPIKLVNDLSNDKQIMVRSHYGDCSSIETFTVYAKSRSIKEYKFTAYVKGVSWR